MDESVRGLNAGHDDGATGSVHDFQEPMEIVMELIVMELDHSGECP